MNKFVLLVNLLSFIIIIRDYILYFDDKYFIMLYIFYENLYGYYMKKYNFMIKRLCVI